MPTHPTDQTAPIPVRLAVRAALDVPGETRRQVRVFAIWFFCLAAAVMAGIAARPRPSSSLEMRDASAEELSRSRRDRLVIASVVGLLIPSLLTWALSHWYRRGGGHARGIVVDVTEEGELRLWGRGYGQRLPLQDARIDERLVDVYAGRLGSWRQRRLRVRRGGAAVFRGVTELEFATSASDADAELHLEGGEGDCIELDRDAFMALRECVGNAVRKGAETAS